MFQQQTSVDPLKVRAFMETEYRVHVDPPVVLRIGVASDALAALHNAHAVSFSAFLTAFNPGSRQHDAGGNLNWHSSLQSLLVAKQVHCVPGIGQHPADEWPGEESFLALGLPLNAAREIGAQFGQDAIVWCGSNAVPQLVMLR